MHSNILKSENGKTKDRNAYIQQIFNLHQLFLS